MTKPSPGPVAGPGEGGAQWYATVREPASVESAPAQSRPVPDRPTGLPPQAPGTPTVSKSEATEPSSKTALMARASSGAIGRTVS